MWFFLCVGWKTYFRYPHCGYSDHFDLIHTELRNFRAYVFLHMYEIPSSEFSEPEVKKDSDHANSVIQAAVRSLYPTRVRKLG